LFKLKLLPLHPKIDDATTATTGKAMPVVFLGVDRKAPIMIVVKRAEPSPIGGEFYILPNKIKG
jgi:hypothetical protein